MPSWSEPSAPSTTYSELTYDYLVTALGYYLVDGSGNYLATDSPANSNQAVASVSSSFNTISAPSSTWSSVSGPATSWSSP